MPRLTFDEFEKPSYEVWREAAEKTLKGASFEKKLFTKTYEDITLKPVYNQDDIAELKNSENLPGFYPYLRGALAGGYRDESWKIVQEIPYKSPADFNKAAKNDLARGVDALCIILDENYGQHVNFINTLEEMETAFDGIDLINTPLSFRAGEKTSAVAALLKAYCDKNGIDSQNICGAFNIDPIADLATKGDINASVEEKAEEIKNLFDFCNANLPGFKVVGINTAPYFNAGSNSVQELGFAMATAADYLGNLVEAGLDINQIAPKFHFHMAIGPNYFMEIAKFRAARMLWSKIVKEFDGNEESAKTRILGMTNKVNKSDLDPYTNMLRATSEVFSAAVGGCTGICVSSFDENLRVPNDFSRRIARNTQLVIKEETHINELADPAGGSYFVEKLTAEVAEAAWNIFREIEKAGGMAKALNDGIPQGMIKEIVTKRRKNIATRKDTLLGTNKYSNITEEKVPSNNNVQEYNPEYKSTDLHINNMAEAVDAATKGVSIFDINSAMNKGKETVSAEALIPFKAFAMYSALRENADKYKAENGEFEKLYLACFGRLNQYKGRADFSYDFFNVGGFISEIGKDFADTNQAAKAFKESGSRVVVICSSDDVYPEVVPGFAKKVKEDNPDATIILAGYPTDYIDQFRNAGVDEFIHVRANNYEILSGLQKKLGIA